MILFFIFNNEEKMEDDPEYVYVLHNKNRRTRVFSEFETLTFFIIKQVIADNYLKDIIAENDETEEEINHIRDVFAFSQRMTLSRFFKKCGFNRYRFIYDEDILFEYVKIEE